MNAHEKLSNIADGTVAGTPAQVPLALVWDLLREHSAVERSLTETESAKSYWHNETERLRQELREANSGGYLGD